MSEIATNTVLQTAELRAEVRRLHGEVSRLRAENNDLRAALDAYVSPASPMRQLVSVEMSAGTCVVPRRRRSSDAGAGRAGTSRG